MAETKLVPFIQDKWYGGVSENEFLGNGMNFGYSQNIDIFTSPKGFQLSKDYDELSFAPSGYITKILRLPNNIQSNAYFTDTGQIWIDSGAGPALVFTLTIADKKILNAVAFGNDLIFFTSGAFHKITFTGNDFKTFLACTESVQTFVADFGGFAAGESLDLPLYNVLDNILYWGGGTKLFSTVTGYPSVVTAKTFPKGNKIIGFSFLNSNLKIYLNHINTDGRLFFWNETTSDGIMYKNRVFKAVTTDGQLDYVVCADGLYVHSGYQYVKVYDKDFSTFGKVGTNYFIPCNLTGIDAHYRYICDNYSLWKYGKKFTSIKNSAVCLDKLFTNRLTAITESMEVEKVYAATDNKKAILRSTTRYNTTGYLESIFFYGASMEKRKKAIKNFIAYILPAATDKIDIYFAIDGGSYPVTANISITGADSFSRKWKEFFVNQMTDLTNHWIKMKFVLTGTSTYITTPIVYENSLIEEYIDNV